MKDERKNALRATKSVWCMHTKEKNDGKYFEKSTFTFAFNCFCLKFKRQFDKNSCILGSSIQSSFEWYLCWLLYWLRLRRVNILNSSLFSLFIRLNSHYNSSFWACLIENGMLIPNTKFFFTWTLLKRSCSRPKCKGFWKTNEKMR